MTSLLHGQRAAFAFAVAGGLALTAITVASMLYFGGENSSGVTNRSGDQIATAELRPFVMHETPQLLPEIGFEDGSGRALTLGGFAGKTVLLNIWATWCVPCREEMPTLDALQAELGGTGFEVLALSIDRAGPDVVREFFAEIGIQHLGLYIDSSMQAPVALAAVGLPTTLLIDTEGRELGRLVGPTEWDAPEMIAFLKTHLTSI